MTISFLENSIGNYLVKKQVRSRKRVPQAINLQQVKTMGVLCEVNSETQVTDVLRGMKTFQVLHIEVVYVVCICMAKEVPKGIPENWWVITPKEVNWWGMPTSEVLRKLEQQPVDLFCNFTNNSSILSTQLTLNHVSKCLTGFAAVDLFELNDLSIEIPVESGVLELSKNIVRYLGLLNIR